MANTAESLNQLILSAQDIAQMTDWPDALIEDYINILRGLIILADTIDNVAGGNSESTVELRAIINNSISSLSDRIDKSDSVGYINASKMSIAEQSIGVNSLRIQALEVENSVLKSLIFQLKTNQDRIDQRVNNLEQMP